MEVIGIYQIILKQEQGRKESENDPNSYFIDDENSKDLFLGYGVAGLRIGNNWKMNIIVDENHPLFVFALWCRWWSGGVTYGLKLDMGTMYIVLCRTNPFSCYVIGTYDRASR